MIFGKHIGQLMEILLGYLHMSAYLISFAVITAHCHTEDINERITRIEIKKLLGFTRDPLHFQENK